VEWYWALLLLVGTVMVLMMIGIPVAIAFFGANLIGALVFFGGEAGLAQVGRNVVDALVNFSLAPITMFILMGEILFHSGVAVRAIDAVEKLIARVPGRLALVAVFGGTIFATLSGSSMANTAMLGSTLLPEMQKRGYHSSIAMGPILGTGGIAMLIPPSGLAVLLGSLSGISIAELLIAAAVPGVIMAVVHSSYVVIRCAISPHLAPSYELPPMTWRQRFGPFLLYVLPLMSLFVVVVGSILAGIATPTESAALGAIGAMIVSICYRAFSIETFRTALAETGKIAVMVLFIIAASLTFSQILSFSGATNGLLANVREMELNAGAIIFAMMAVMLLLGCIMDPVSIMLITLPFFIPLAELAHVNLVWFGVLMLLALEIGQTTPPFGLLLFVMKGIAPAGTTMGVLYRAVAPFIILEIMILIGLILFPEAVIWLPKLMRG